MCSDYITNSASCYVDNFVKILDVVQTAIVIGAVVAILVGVVVFFLKKP